MQLDAIHSLKEKQKKSKKKKKWLPLKSFDQRANNSKNNPKTKMTIDFDHSVPPAA